MPTTDPHRQSLATLDTSRVPDGSKACGVASPVDDQFQPITILLSTELLSEERNLHLGETSGSHSLKQEVEVVPFYTHY